MSSSLGRIAAIARTTFTELARLRVFYVLVLFALVLIISASFLARISFQQELQVTRDIALGAINFFLSMLAIVATAQLLPRDLEIQMLQGNDPPPSKRRGEYFGDVTDANSRRCHVRISNPRESGGVARAFSDSFLIREPKSL